jgi:hypothetical protein
MFKISISL